MGEPLTERELGILLSIVKGEGIETAAKRIGIPPGVMGMEIARLQLKGFISQDGSLTKEGMAALGMSKG